MILPRSPPNVVPRTTGVGTIPRWGTSRSAAPPPGTFCPPLPPFVVDDVSRQRISSAVVAARGRGSSSRAKASRRTASSESGRYSVCSTQMFTYGPSRKGSLLCTCPYRFTVASGTSFIAICVTTSVGLPVMTRVHPRCVAARVGGAPVPSEVVVPGHQDLAARSAPEAVDQAVRRAVHGDVAQTDHRVAVPYAVRPLLQQVAVAVVAVPERTSEDGDARLVPEVRVGEHTHLRYSSPGFSLVPISRSDTFSMAAAAFRS